MACSVTVVNAVIVHMDATRYISAGSSFYACLYARCAFLLYLWAQRASDV